MANHLFMHRLLHRTELLRPLLAAAILALAFGSAVAQTSAAQARAGQVMSVTGRVVATDQFGQERFLEKGADVRPGDKIVTGDAALIQMRMSDGGYLSVRSGTEMAIERFVFDAKESANSGMLVSLLKGGFRSITGLIGRTNPGAYAIRSPTATVGIRGTDHEPMVILPGHASGAAPGLYDKVNEGETFIRTELGLLALTRGQVGFAPVVPDRAPQVLPAVPEFYKIEIKTDARDPRDATTNATTTSRAAEGDKGDKTDKSDTGGLLRPSTAARREALKDAAADTLKDGSNVGAEKVDLSGALVNRTAIASDLKIDAVKTLDAASTTLSTDKAIATTTLTTTSMTTLKDAAVVTSPTTSSLLTAPLTTTILKDAVVAPTTSTLTTTIQPALSTTTLSTTSKTTLLAAPVTTTTTAKTATAPATTTTTTTSTKTLTAPTTTLKSQILTR